MSVNLLFLYSWLGGLYLGLGGLHLRLGSFRPMVGNIVQVMGNVMATATFREFRYDAGGMRHSVTIFTAGNHFVFILMTGYAAEITMLGLVGRQQVKGLVVAAFTLFGFQVLAKGNRQGHMSLMAIFAVCLDHCW